MEEKNRGARYDEAGYDRLLSRLADYGSELANGFTNHAPMVIDALAGLGRLDAAEAWLDRYLPGALPCRAASPAIDFDSADWRAALGRVELEGAWFAGFAADLAAEDWRAPLTRGVEYLAPGFAAAAAHGVIRTAHAARALSRVDSPLRRTELAAGLALWASSWQALPGAPLAGQGALRARDALREITLVPPERRRNAGAITTALTVLAGHDGFGAALGGLDRARPPDDLALDLAQAFVQVFLDQVRSPLQAIVFTHAVTGVAAARRLGRLVGGTAASSLLAHAWQTGAALYACYAEHDAQRPASRVPTVDELIGAAVAHGDEHVIKLAEACIEFHGWSRDPAFLAAAWRAVEVIPRT